MDDKRHYAGLDIVRAIAALSVLGLHVLSTRVSAPRTVLGAIVAQLGSGVAIFFVLSGYLLYRPFARATLAAVPLPDRRRFWGNRVRRIVPAYWTALTFYLVIGLVSVTPAMGPLCYAFLQAWVVHHQAEGIPPAWTLCSEMAFYLLLPFIAAKLDQRRGQHAALIVRDLAVAIAALWVLRIIVVDIGTRIRPVIGEIDVTLVGTLDMFLIGMTLAVIVADPDLQRRALRVVPRWRVAWPAALVLYLAVAAPGSMYNIAQWSVIGRVWAMAIALLLIAPLVLRPHDAPSGSVAKAFAFLGLVSYGIYIWHYPLVTSLYHDGLASWARVVISVAAAIAIGIASYFIVERRFLKTRKSQQPPMDAPPVIEDSAAVVA